MLYSLGCVKQIKYPTRITQLSATLIDHIYTNNVTHESTSHILTEDISDHLPIMLLINNSIHKAIPSNNYIRDAKKCKIKKLCK